MAVVVVAAGVVAGDDGEGVDNHGVMIMTVIVVAVMTMRSCYRFCRRETDTLTHIEAAS